MWLYLGGFSKTSKTSDSTKQKNVNFPNYSGALREIKKQANKSKKDKSKH
jgi:hypothetical protein